MTWQRNEKRASSEARKHGVRSFLCFKDGFHALEIIGQKPIFTILIEKADGFGLCRNDICAPVIIGMKEKMSFGIEEENGGGQLPKALEIGRQNAFQQGGNEGRRLLHIPKKENARHRFLIRRCDLLLIDLGGRGQMRERAEAVDDGADICFQIRRAIQYPEERIKRRDFFI